MKSDEKMEVAKKLRIIYAKAVSLEHFIEEIVGEHFMEEMQQIDGEESKAIFNAVKDGKLDQESSIDEKQKKLEPWLKKVLGKSGENDGE